MASILELDPDTAGLANAASILGKLSEPSRTPVGLGSIIGQAAGGFQQGRNQATMQAAQLQQMKDVAGAKELAVAEARRQAESKAKFNSILGELQSSGQPLDEISILGAGIQSGAFGPRETTDFMGKVMEKKAAREAKLETEQLRLADRAIAREEREAAERRLIQLRAEMKQETDRLAAALKPQRQERMVPVEENGQVVYVPQSEAAGRQVGRPGQPNKSLTPNAIKELGEKGEAATSFIRLSNTFKDDFGGKGSALVGDMQNLYGRNVGGGKSEQADWWQDYQNQKNLIRNKLFGSALTATEAAEFDKANINPGMKPELIKKNLARQKAAAARAARRLSEAYKEGGYSDAQIMKALGLSEEDLAEDGGGKDPWE